MSDQLQLWLIPPLLTAFLSIWFRRKLTLEFGWPLLVQASSIILAAVSGLLSGPKPLCTIITWILFVMFMVVPNLYLRQCEHLYSTLNAGALKRTANRIPLLYWGKLGKFWKEIYQAYALYILGDEQSGDRIMNYWKALTLPPFFEEHIESTQLAVDGLLWRWDAIIEEYKRRELNPHSVSASLSLQASRAFAEKGDFDMATKCLMSANLPNQRMDQRHMALVYLQYFCLAGAEAYAHQLVATLSKGAPPSMQLILNIWWARCLLSAGKRSESIALLQKLLLEAHDFKDKKFDTTAWISRLENYLRDAQNGDYAASSATLAVNELDDIQLRQKNIAQIWQTYQNALNVQKIVLPRKSSKALSGLILLMVCTYVLSGCIDLIDNPVVTNIIGPNSDLLALAVSRGEFMFKHYYLEKSLVYAGEYYRLVTYIFLHGNLSHLILNVIGLIWFGRIATAVYGTWRFLVIFFAAGIAGGLAQIFFTDTSAVGASGSVFGLFAAVAVAIFKLRDVLPAQLRMRELRWMTVMTICQIGLDHVIPRVAGFAHLGGLVAGLAMGWLLFPSNTFKNSEQKQSQGDKSAPVADII